MKKANFVRALIEYGASTEAIAGIDDLDHDAIARESWAHEALMESFTWAHSEDGTDYWQTIYTRLRAAGVDDIRVESWLEDEEDI